MWRCPTDACFQRQMDYAITRTNSRGKHEYLYVPLPKQVVFIEAVLSGKWKYILFGGAAGGSKSHALRWLGHYLCLKYPGFHAILLRRTYPELEETHLLYADAETKRLTDKDCYKSSERAVFFPNGSRFKFGHCEKTADLNRYLSAQYDLILFDEQTLFEEEQIVGISTRARSTRADWTPVVAGGTNPFGPGAEYCRSHFLDKNPDPDQYEFYDSNDYLYIRSRLDDNPYLPESYLRTLQSYPKAKRRAYIEGDWDSFDGQYFEEFRKTDQQQTHGPVLKAHTQDVTYGPEFDRFCSMDWGFSDKGVVLWWVCLSDSRYAVEDEYVFNKTNIPDVAAEIKRRNRERGIKVRYTVASPDLFPQTGQIGESRAETFRKNGVPLRKANNDRKSGWQRVRELFRADAAGYPTLTINPRTCPYLCRTLPQLVSDKNDPEDVAQHKDDHAAESLRYGAMSRPAPTRTPAKPKPPPGTVGYELNRALALARARQYR